MGLKFLSFYITVSLLVTGTIIRAQHASTTLAMVSASLGYVDDRQDRLKSFFQRNNKDLDSWAKDATPADPAKQDLADIFNLQKKNFSIWANARTDSALWGSREGNKSLLAIENPLKKTGRTILANQSGNSLVIDSSSEQILFVGDWQGKGIVITRSPQNPKRLFAYVDFKKWEAELPPAFPKSVAQYIVTDPTSRKRYQLNDPASFLNQKASISEFNGQGDLISPKDVVRIGKVGEDSYAWERPDN